MWWIIIGILWYLAGVAGYIYYWTQAYDFNIMDAVICLFVGIFGPIVWVVMTIIWLVERKFWERVLIKKR